MKDFLQTLFHRGKTGRGRQADRRSRSQLSALTAFMAIFCCGMPARASILTIGSGTASSSYAPVYTYYGYTYSQTIILASEIVAAGATAGSPGYINSISFNPTNYYSDFGTKCKDWVLYLGTTTKTSFTGAGDWIPYSGLTKVFDGTCGIVGTGWYTFTLSAPYYWDGVSNIVIAADENTSGYTSSGPMYWQGTTRSANRTVYFYNDATNPDPVSPPGASVAKSGVTTITPDVKLDYTPATPCSGTTVGGTAVATATTLCPGSTAILNVTGATSATGLTYSWDTASSATGPWGTAPGTVSAASYTATPPTGKTTYYRRSTTCTATGSLGYSTPVAITVSSPIIPPYTEDFESAAVGVNPACAGYTNSWVDASNWYIRNTPYATGVANHTAGGSKYLLAGWNMYTSQEMWFTPGIQLAAGKTYRFSYWYSNDGYAYYNPGTGAVIGKSQTKAAMTPIGPYVYSTLTTYSQYVTDFTVPSDGIYFIGINMLSTGNWGWSFDDLNLIELPQCNTATAAAFAAPGKASVNPNTVCTVPSTATLSVSKTPAFSGLGFAWEMATGAPTGFTPITGAVTATSTYTVPASGVYYFRCKVSCIATGMSGYSDTVKLVTVPITPPYTEDFESGAAGVNMPCAGTTNWGSIPYYFNLAVAPYSLTSAPGIVNHTAGGSKYLHAGYYLGYNTSNIGQFWFTPGLSLTGGKAYSFSYWFSNSGYAPSSYATYPTEMGVYAGTAQNAAGMTIPTDVDTTIYLDAISTPTYNNFTRGFVPATSGTYYVGIKINHKNYCYYGLAIDDINFTQLPSCSARPSAGKAFASPSLICTSGTSNLSLLGYSLASDLSFQWQVSVTGASGSFSDIPGATASYYTTPVLTVGATPSPLYYRCYIICSGAAMPNSDTSVVAKVTVGPLDMPYVENFESGSDGVNMTCAAVAGSWGTSVNYWYMRSGMYSTSYPGVDNHTPGGKRYLYSGYGNGPYSSSGDQYYWFTPALKMTAGKGYSVGFWYNGAGYATGTNGLKLGIYAGTTQSAAGMTIRAGGVDTAVDGASGTYRSLTRGFVAPTTGSYYIGLKTVHTGYNYPGIPLDDINIQQLPDCSGKPIAGVPDALPVRICSSGTTTLRLTGTSIASSITYKWLQGTSPTAVNTPCSTGTGFTAGNYTTPSLTATTYYRCVVTCTTSGLSDTSSVITVSVGPITPPYRENFEGAVPGINVACASNSSSWVTSSTTTYWTIKAFPYTAYATIHKNRTPGGSNYLWAGYYLGYASGAASGAMWFTPGISLVKDSTYEFSLWYQGAGYYYYNSAPELGMWYGTAQTEAAMTNQVRSLWVDKRSTYRQMIGRFKSVGTGTYYMGIRVKHLYSAYSYYGTSIDDIALDMLAPCNGAPTAGPIWAKPGMLCSPGTTALDMDYTGVTKAAGLTYRWEWTNTDPTSGPFLPVGTSAVLTAPTFTTGTLSATTWFRCVVKCNNTNDSTASSVIKVDVGGITLPYFQDFETVDQGSNAPCASNTNSFSASSTAYWGVYRVPITTSSLFVDNHTPGGTAYLNAGTSLGAYSSGANEWWFTPKVTLTAGKEYYFAYWYIGSGYSGGGKTDLAAGYGPTNTAAGMTTIIGTPVSDVSTSIWQKYEARIRPVSTGDYYIGIRVNHKVYSFPGVAIDDIALQEVPPCSAPVVAGTIKSTPAMVCSPGGTTNLSLEGSTLAIGLSYDWYTYNPVTGAMTPTGGTGVPYNTDPLTANTYFKCVVTCATTGKSDTTAAFMVPVGGKSIPYVEDFESVSANEKPLCSDATVWGNSILWNTQIVNYGTLTNNTPGGKGYLIAGYYLGYFDYSSGAIAYTATHANYWFTPGLNLDSRYKYKLTFWYQANTTANRIGVFYGTAQTPSAMTNTLRPFGNVTNATYLRFDTTFTPPTTRVYYIGFQKSTTDFGVYAYPGVAFDDINVNYAPCDALPMAGSIEGTVPSGTPSCVGTKTTLRDIGATINLVPGIKYQWMRRDLSAPSTGWKAVAGATDSILRADTLIGYEYKFAVVCGNTNDTAYSAVYQLPAHPAHPPVSIAPATSPVTFCIGDTVKFNATNFSGGVYDWMRDSVVVPGWKFSDMGAVDAGTYMVRVSSPLSPCPGYSNQVKLIANDPGYTVTITKPADSILCAGSSVLLTAVASKPGVTYQWRKDNVSIPGATGTTYLVTTAGYYRVMISDGVSSCAAASRNVLMQVKPNPPAVITVPGGTTTACENEGVLLRANVGAFTYEWSRGGTPVVGLTDSAIVVKNTGRYAVKVRSADGCVSMSSSVTVNILPSPIPVIVRTTIPGLKDELSTTLSYPFYQWIRNGADIAGANAPTYNLAKKGLYKVRVTGTNNCEGESTPIEAMEDWLSLKEANMNAAIKVYPNPTTGKVTIESPVSISVQVKDLAGKTIFNEKDAKEVDLSKYADGVYMFILSKDNEVIGQQRVTKSSK